MPVQPESLRRIAICWNCSTSALLVTYQGARRPALYICRSKVRTFTLM